MIRENVFLAPAKPLFEALGAETRWSEANQILSGIMGTFRIDLVVGDSRVIVGDETEEWKAPVEKIDGVVYAPVEPLAEALGAYMEWSGDTRTIEISTPQSFDPQDWEEEGPGPPLHVAFPPPQYSIYGSPIFVFGTTLSYSQVDVMVNGEPVDRFDPRTGNFLTMVDVPRDEDFVIMIQATGPEGETTTIERSVSYPTFWEEIPPEPLQIHPTHLKPDRDQVLSPGEDLRVVARGSPGAKAEFWIGDDGDRVAMTELEGRPGVYAGTYRIREGDASEPGSPKVQPIQVALERDGKQVSRELSARVTIIPDSPYKVVEVKERAHLTVTGWWRSIQSGRIQLYGNTPGGTAHPTTTMGYLVEGTRYNILGASGDYYRTRLKDDTVYLIRKDAVRTVEDREIVESSPAWLMLSETDERMRLRITTTDRIPFHVKDHSRRIELDLYGIGEVFPASETLEAVKDIKLESLRGEYADAVRLTVELKEELTGFKCHWDGTHLILDIFKPPSVSKDFPLEGKVIVVDPGHGGTDLGALGPADLHEKDVVLEMSLLLKGMLEDEGAQVIMTRTQDKDVNLYERPLDLGEVNADFFISVHTNAHAQGAPAVDLHGLMTLYDYAHNERVARIMMDRLASDTKLPEFRVWMRKLAVLRHPEVPSVLVEAGYLKHPQDNWHVLHPAGQEELARAMKEGIKDYFLSFKVPSDLDVSRYFSDSGDWEGEPFTAAAYFLGHAGVFEGDRGNLLPGNPLTREEMAAVLARVSGQDSLADALKDRRTTFSDDDQIAPWARGYMVLAEDEGWFKGYPDGTVRPKNNLTLAEIAALLARVTDNEHLAEGPWPSGAMNAAEDLALFEDVETVRSDREILRGEMVSATFAAMIAPGQLGEESEGGDSLETPSLLERNYVDTWHYYRQWDE